MTVEETMPLTAEPAEKDVAGISTSPSLPLLLALGVATFLIIGIVFVAFWFVRTR